MRQEIPTIDWTRAKLERFAKLVEATKGDTLVFEGHTFVKRYAEYLVEYLRSQLL
jgi:hypothetical protein